MGKLSDVLRAVEDVAADLDVQVNSAVAVVDASKAKMYIKNFGDYLEQDGQGGCRQGAGVREAD